MIDAKERRYLGDLSGHKKRPDVSHTSTAGASLFDCVSDCAASTFSFQNGGACAVEKIPRGALGET